MQREGQAGRHRYAQPENAFILTRHCRALRPERLKGSRKVEINAGGALPPEIWTIRKLSILPHLSLPGL